MLAICPLGALRVFILTIENGNVAKRKRYHVIPYEESIDIR